MNKIFLLLVAMTMIFGVAFALDGLSLGAGFRHKDFDADPAGTAMEMRFDALYEGVFMDEALELDATVGFNMVNFDDMENDIDIELELRYNMGISDVSKLTFILNSLTDIPFADDAEYVSWLKPGVKLGQTFGFGDMFFQLDFPIFLMDGYDPGFDSFDFVNMDLTISLFKERKFRGPVSGYGAGYGGEIKLSNELSNPYDNIDPNFPEALTITPFYSSDLWYAEVEVGMPLYEDGMDIEGMSITPKFEMDIAPVEGLSFWLDVPITNLGAKDFAGDSADPIFGVGVGLNFKF